MARKPRDSTFVITGASSAIGRATALALAGRGAAVVLAARRAEPLDALAARCARLGGLALAVPTDVTDPDAARALARRAIETFGRIDAWVNAGGAEEDDVPAVRNGSGAALPYMREQASGVIVNVARSASRGGVRDLGASLRAELAGTPLEVVTVLSGAAVRPRVSPEEIAGAIVAALARPAPEVFLPGSARPRAALPAAERRSRRLALVAVVALPVAVAWTLAVR